MFTGEAWVGGKFSSRVTFIKAKDCNFDKANFNRELQKDDEEKIAISEIEECHMRYLPCYSHHWEANGYWETCPPGRGASLYYYAEVGYKEGD
jgi:hypothetical protein